MNKDAKIALIIAGFVLVGIGLIVWGCMAGIPKYKVWQQGLAGQAELKRAEQNRQIQVEEAKAMRESAIELAQAEVERAKGMAESNEIVGKSLEGNTEYLIYLWIQALRENDSDVIYVPTEGNLPILEAGRMFGKK